MERYGTKAGIFVTSLAAVVALLLIAAAPAFADDGDNRHPSGKDRSVENGGSGTQGKSGSDPDGDSNGGPDKPNGSGGTDKADQDGNNGCGNDDDFEDDNNGNCGGKGKNKDKVKGADAATDDEVKGTKGTKDTKDDDKVCTEDATMGTTTEACGPEVLGGVIQGGSIADVNDDVLGTLLNRGSTAPKALDRAAPAAGGKLLPFTGAALLWLLALAAGLIGSGVLFWRRDRT